MKINGNLVFNTDASGEIQNAYLERRASAPTFNGAEAGRVYYDTSDGLYYYNDGVSWVPFATGGNAAGLQTEVDNIEATLGGGITGTGTIGTFDAVVTSIVGTTPTTWTQVINALALEAQSTDTLAELDDVSMGGTLSSGHILYYNGTNWVNSAPGAAAGVQAHDVGLDSLSSITGPGFVSVGADGNTFAARTFQMPAAGIAMTNTSGGGNPSISLTNDLAAVEGLTTNGIAVRTATDTWATRSVVGGSTGTIIVDDGNGVSGDPTLDLQTLTIPTNSGTFYKFSYDTHGRVTAVQAVVAADITGLVDTVYVNVTGDTMAGTLNMNGNSVTNLAAPVNANDAVTKNYVDAALTGLTWEAPVLGIVANAAGLPGSPTTGDRYYQTDINSIVEWSGSAWVPEVVVEGASFFDTSSETGYVGTGTGVVQFTGTGQISAGAGLVKTGNVLDVNFGAGIAQLPSDEVGVHIYNYTGSAFGFATPGGVRVATEAAAGSNDLLSLFLDGSTLGQSGNGLKVAAGGITEVEINSSAIGANAGITGGSGTKLALNVNTSHLEVSSNVLSIKDNGVTTVKILNGNVTNAKLQHSTISLSDGITTDSVALGETVTLSGTNGIAVTVANNAVDVTLAAGLEELADVDIGLMNSLTGGNSGSVLTYQGIFDTWGPQKIYFLYVAPSAATSHAITHNIGQQYCNVTVVDEADEVVIPQSITFNSANQLTVTFTSALLCKVIIMGMPILPQT